MSKTYIATAEYRFFVGWRCTKCGKVSIKAASIRSHAEGPRNVSGIVKSDMIAKVIQTQVNQSIISYVPYLNELFCVSCGQEECWMKWKNMDSAVKITLMTCLSLILFAVISLLCGKMSAAIILAVLATAVIAISMFYFNKVGQSNAILREAIQAVPAVDQPIITTDLQLMEKLMKLKYAQGNAELSTEIERQINILLKQ